MLFKYLVLLCLVYPAFFLAASCDSKSPMPHERSHSFADVESYAKRFEDPARLEWQRPDEVVKRMGLKNGDMVADVGAGTGYFARRIAKAVAPGGAVTGYDIEKGMIEYMKEDARKLGLANYRAELIDAKEPALPAGRFAVIFMCNTYHHIEERVPYLRALMKGLAAGGRVIILDTRMEAKDGPPVKLRLEKNTVIAEFAEAGLALLKDDDFLKDQYYLEFSMKK